MKKGIKLFTVKGNLWIANKNVEAETSDDAVAKIQQELYKQIEPLRDNATIDVFKFYLKASESDGNPYERQEK